VIFGTVADETQLEEAITALYLSPLEDFIPRRDALTKELRSAGDRAAATRVKALRKPSRAAWALNVAAADGGALRKLVDSVAATLDAQADGSDVRAAMTRLRTAVRELADSAAVAASDAGHSIDSATFATASWPCSAGRTASRSCAPAVSSPFPRVAASTS